MSRFLLPVAPVLLLPQADNDSISTKTAATGTSVPLARILTTRGIELTAPPNDKHNFARTTTTDWMREKQFLRLAYVAHSRETTPGLTYQLYTRFVAQNSHKIYAEARRIQHVSFVFPAK